MKYACMLAPAVVTLATLLYAAAPPADEAKLLKSLCDDLGSDEYPKRENASSELFKHGARRPYKVLPLMNEAAESKDLEVSRRAKRVRTKILYTLEESTIFDGTADNAYVAGSMFVRCKLGSILSYPRWSYWGSSYDVMDIHVQNATGSTAVLSAPVSAYEVHTDTKERLTQPLPQVWSGLACVSLPPAKATSLTRVELGVKATAPAIISAAFIPVDGPAMQHSNAFFSGTLIGPAKISQPDKVTVVLMVTVQTKLKDGEALPVAFLLRDQDGHRLIPGEVKFTEKGGKYKVEQHFDRPPTTGAPQVLCVYQLSAPSERTVTFVFKDVKIPKR